MDILEELETIKQQSLILKVQIPLVGLFGSGEQRQVTLKADVGITDGKQVRLLVEVDGGYHFGKDSGRGRPPTSVEHDMKKERYALENRIPMVRISTNLVSKPEKYWRALFEEAITRALHVKCFSICRLSNTACYLDTIYGSLRKGTALEVEDSVIDVPLLYRAGS